MWNYIRSGIFLFVSLLIDDWRNVIESHSYHISIRLVEMSMTGYCAKSVQVTCQDQRILAPLYVTVVRSCYFNPQRSVWFVTWKCFHIIPSNVPPFLRGGAMGGWPKWIHSYTLKTESRLNANLSILEAVVNTTITTPKWSHFDILN